MSIEDGLNECGKTYYHSVNATTAENKPRETHSFKYLKLFEGARINGMIRQTFRKGLINEAQYNGLLDCLKYAYRNSTPFAIRLDPERRTIQVMHGLI